MDIEPTQNADAAMSGSDGVAVTTENQSAEVTPTVTAKPVAVEPAPLTAVQKAAHEPRVSPELRRRIETWSNVIREISSGPVEKAAAVVAPVAEAVAAEPEPLATTPPAEATREPVGSSEPVNVEVIAEPANSVTEGDRMRFMEVEGALWGTSGNMRVFLAAKQDGKAGLVTTSLPAMRANGMIPTDASLAPGDLVLIEVKNAMLVWRVNRANGASLATVWPSALAAPRWKEEGGSEFLEFPATVIGPVGYRKTPRVRAGRTPTPVGNVVVPQVEEVKAA